MENILAVERIKRPHQKRRKSDKKTLEMDATGIPKNVIDLKWGSIGERISRVEVSRNIFLRITR